MIGPSVPQKTRTLVQLRLSVTEAPNEAAAVSGRAVALDEP